MKSLIICAEYVTVWKPTEDCATRCVVKYTNITCFGQSKKLPRMTCIVAGQTIDDSCYDDLIKYCKSLYCKYYVGEDDFNICTVEYLVNIEH